MKKGNIVSCNGKSWRRDIKLNAEQRKDRVKEKIQKAIQKRQQEK